MTYNNIIKYFENFAANHMQINTFHSGELADYQAKTNIYPGMIIISQPGSITTKIVTLSFNIFFYDILNIDSSNVEEVKSDMLSICSDLLKRVEVDYNTGLVEFILTDDTKALEPFVEVLDDNVAGWMINIKIQYALKNNCIIPMK